ncbi:Cobalamin synthase [Jannaschia seosinensis]|uniref:Adenosylcobinamide-GDP ribazoletransferase n=1 Tax=Jannaschia seosinensis TaxID=313367 RepID=A0A0M7BBJ9_9RHOB|nr:adenosylcobinamide-GDP ribazoletransferase [Jannaschia seosinensis]CUH39771.1 Cobalamin synthase [Jannaschia seosinensis]
MTFRSDMISAAMLLTRLPVRGEPTAPAARAAWAWPLVGLVVGLAAGLAGVAGWALGATPAVAATLVIAVSVLLTGALHEDGLADTADGLWGGAEPARRLEIMRDSRIGSYGVIALILLLLLRWSLIATALIQGHVLFTVIAAAMVSRAAMAVLMRWQPHARADGLSHGTGRPPAHAVWIAVALAALALLPAGAHGLAAAALVAAALWALGRVARAKIGGQTGDLLGACQQISEVAVLVALTSA